MRNVFIVIDTIKEMSTNERFKENLETIKKDSAYLAPELMYLPWNEIAFHLNKFYPNPTENEESINIYMEFSTLSREEIIEKEAQKKARRDLKMTCRKTSRGILKDLEG